jgi:hypothetical protein
MTGRCTDPDKCVDEGARARVGPIEAFGHRSEGFAALALGRHRPVAAFAREDVVERALDHGEQLGCQQVGRVRRRAASREGAPVSFHACGKLSRQAAQVETHGLPIASRLRLIEAGARAGGRGRGRCCRR